jgi:glycosyltransferase involved in cell wall biosynthesis
VDILYASGQPFATFAIGSLVKRATAKPLLLDYRDPWTLNPFYKGSSLRKILETQIEKFVLRTADAAIFTTPEARALQQSHRMRPERRHFYHTISNSFESAPVPFITSRAADDHFRLIHAGNLYGSRNPACLFKAAAMAARRSRHFSTRTKLVFFGLFSTTRYEALARHLGIGHMVEFGARLTRAELERQYRKAGALLLINSYGNGHQVFIPSKFFEYLKIGLPIFCLAEAGALKTAVDRTRSGTVVDPQNTSQIAEQLLSFFQRFYIHREDYRPNEREIARHEASHTTRKLVRLCEDLARRQPQRRLTAKKGKPEWKI